MSWSVDVIGYGVNNARFLFSTNDFYGYKNTIIKCVVGAYYLLSLSLKGGMSVGAAYGIWAALGISILAIIGAFFFRESFSLLQIVGIVFIIG
ncbi:DMT family transporter [Myroides indicus]|uniref:Small Multidrug Resistance (SMR) protein n=1 Tax=Myroides indicus TaxID=1323422 RepID=A0A4R7FCU3_9FLAO|nr:SMR family transporter [Myroides indicus]TDS65073.1 Small Multidrug Resistance (SMR) protein [Myroides indicus]